MRQIFLTFCVVLSAAFCACGGAIPSDDGVRAWADWPMPNQPGRGLPNPQKYSVLALSGDVVVQDDVTGLLWQQLCDLGRFSWQEATAHCRGSTMGGWQDWRLPSRIELASLLNLSTVRPTIDIVAFPDTPPEWFWTTSPQANAPDRAWYAYFYFGYPDTDDKDQSYAARCVRGASPVGPYTITSRYELRADTARDVKTHLTWQRMPSDGKHTFTEAATICAELDLAGNDDWRVPSLQEFQTIVDERREYPAIDPTVFPQTPPEGFWTTTAWAGTPMLAWHADFDRGSAAYDLETMPYWVRCVRSEP